MTDVTANPQTPVDNAPGQTTSQSAGQVAISRLAHRIAAMAPQPVNLSPDSIVPPAPVMEPQAAPGAAIAQAAEAPARRSRSVIGRIVDSFVSACSFIPYALVALALRLVMARIFFFDGQTRVTGPQVPVSLYDFDFSVVLPLQVKPETFTAFSTQYPPMPVPPTIAAYLVSYAEFILPIMLVLGLGTRFAVVGLLIMTAMIQIYVLPDALWTVHVYWAAILAVLLSRGPGAISIDHIIRWIARR